MTRPEYDRDRNPWAPRQGTQPHGAPPQQGAAPQQGAPAQQGAIRGQGGPGAAAAPPPVPGQAAAPMPPGPFGRPAVAPGQPGTAIGRPGPDTGALAVPPAVPGRTLARPEAGTAATAAAAATAVAAPPMAYTAPSGVAGTAPQGPHEGTVYRSRRPAAGANGHGIPSGRLPRLHVSSHLVSLSALAHLGVASPGTGLILGADVEGRAVPVRFFRPEPTTITLVGGAWAAQVVLFRALALGVRTVVMTGDPASWQGFGERATGQSGRVAVLHGEQPMAFAATPQQPVLVVYDLGLVGPSTAPDLGPWQTQLTVLRRLDEPGVPSVEACQMVMMQRLSLVEAALAASALRLTGQSAQLLQRMEDDMVALLGGGADRYVWLSQTGTERQFLGPPRR
jgi:hypothetical protein